MKKAVVVLSGGMDSATAAYIASLDNYMLIAVHFNYQQITQSKELQAFRMICDSLNIDKRYEIDLDFFAKIGASALTDSSIEVPVDGLGLIQKDAPVTYVPFRNGIFLSIASAIAEKEFAEAIFIGVVQEDGSGYPDCTQDFIRSIEHSIDCGTKKKTHIKIKTPLLQMQKEEIVAKALAIGVPLELTWSCYKNSVKACGVCDSCRLRLKGFELCGVLDKIQYEAQ